MTELLRQLTQCDAPSGCEDEVRTLIRSLAEPYADEIREDALGNLIVVRRSESKKKREPLILAAHMDEVGAIVTDSVGDGFYGFEFIGSVDVRVALGKRVRVLSRFGKRSAVIAPGKAWHLASSDERSRAGKPHLDALGNTALSPGDYVAFDSEFTLFGDGFVKAKALDDRVGCAIMLTLMRESYDRDVVFAFTVQEEVGTRGAAVAAHTLRSLTSADERGLRVAPVILVLESTAAADVPPRSGGDRVCVLGGGAVLPFMDGGAIYDRALRAELLEIADAHSIATQTKSRIAGGTDARAFQAAGARVAAISLPARNIHSPACVAKLSDLDCMLELTRAYLSAPTSS
ncbi:MAG: M42 family peptidase [Oscillospiraceae bacterium]|jgi:endoglucanase|nr:M42 family peptidase [Oscillospiraceae bacterium]